MPFDQVSHLRDILTLSPLLPSVNKTLDEIVQQVMITTEPLEDFQRTPYNASLVLGMCLTSFSGQVKSPRPDISSFNLTEMCQRWGWSESVTNGLACLATSRYGVIVDAFRFHD